MTDASQYPMKFHYFIGKRDCGTTEGAARLVAAHYSRFGRVGIVTDSEAKAEVYREALRDCPHPFFVQVDDACELCTLRPVVLTLACLVLDGTIISGSTMWRDALQAAQNSVTMRALVVCARWPVTFEVPPDWVSQEDWHVQVLSEYRTEAPASLRWMEILKSRPPFQLDANDQGPAPCNTSG
jgi:hypothetical protein